uniref:Kidney associated antigen 1 n=1 Tax=Ficedula albicollis TaxID=59894 RepID=A0A803V3P9_FICAL
VDDDAAPREERVPVAIHQHALHGRLREPGRLGAGTSHAAGSVRSAPAGRAEGRGAPTALRHTLRTGSRNT